MLKEHVKEEFLDLPIKLWSDAMVIEFIIKTIELDSDIYDAIVDVDHADLYQHMAKNENYNSQRKMNEIKGAMLVNAKEQVNLIIKDIEYDIEEERKEKLKEHQAGLVCKVNPISEEQNLKSEGVSFDNQRLM